MQLPCRNSKTRGFTIVELLIVIVVLAILVSVGVVNWTATLGRSQNETRKTELVQWKNTFALYKSRFGAYPPASTAGTYCVGDDFPGDRCGVNKNRLENTTLNTNIARVTRLPAYGHPEVTSGSTSYLGPYVTITSGGAYTLVGVLQGGPSDCPEGTTSTTAPVSGAVVYCNILLP